MVPSGRFAHAHYPAEVEDLISDTSVVPSVAAVAGYAILATDHSRALIFAVALGSAIDTVSLPLQQLPSSSPPALALWKASEHSVCAAALTEDGVLRIFRNIDLKEPTLHCEEIRVGGALNSERFVAALHVVHLPSKNELYIFGAQGCTAAVSLRETRLSVRPLPKEMVSTRASRIGTMFYSAFQSIGVDLSRNAHWLAGTGQYAVVGHGVAAGAVIVARCSGDIERWDATGIVWTCNVFDLIGKSDSRRLVTAGVTSDGTIAMLTNADQESTSGRSIVCFDVRGSEPPKTASIDMQLHDNIEEEVFMTISGDIAYIYMQRSRTLAWMSVARGVSSDGQVLGSTTVDAELTFFAVLDASFGLAESSETGGVVACLHPRGVWLATCAVPAPMCLDVEDDGRAGANIDELLPMLWRAFLQYNAGQGGAAKASLRALMNYLASKEFQVEETLSAIVESVSRKIITSDSDPDKGAALLLIDTELEKKQKQHAALMRMFADGDLFAQLRSQAPSFVEDRIWDAITLSSRSAVLMDGEKLAAAARVRDIENVQPGYIQRFNDAAAASVLESNTRAGIARSMATICHGDENNNIARDVPNVLKDALAEAGAGLPRRRNCVEDISTLIYQYPSEFQRFLPALEKCLSESLGRLESDQNIMDDHEGSEVASDRRVTRSIVVQACEAAIAVAQGAREAREENKELFSCSRNGTTGAGSWVCDYSTCRKMLAKIADKALKVATRSTRRNREQINHVATQVVDQLLASASLDAASRGVLLREEGTYDSHKRRRVDTKQDPTDFVRELRWSLHLLRKSGLNDSAFELAEKYGDYGTMLMLRINSLFFDQFMETELRKFGDDFGLYAFQWLEDRGRLHLLLKGWKGNINGAGDDRAVGRSDRMIALLSKYFQTDRNNVSNLSWMHWLLVGNLESGGKALLDQVKNIAQPGRQSSVLNTKIVGSVAKLAMFADGIEGERAQGSTRANFKQVCRRLQLTDMQEQIEPKETSLISAENLIRKLVNEGSSNSEQFAARVIVAVEALHVSTDAGDLEDKAGELEDFVWRRCVERQKDIFEPLANNISAFSDIELRERLMNTALFMAAQAVRMTEADMARIIERGALSSSDFKEQGCLVEVARLAKTAVALAVA